MAGKKTRKVAEKGKKKEGDKKGAKVLDILKPEHLKMIEALTNKKQIAELTLINFEQVLANKNLELKLLQRDIEKQKNYVAQKDAVYKLEFSKCNNFMSSITTLYNITDEFGYRPDTGVIVRK